MLVRLTLAALSTAVLVLPPVAAQEKIGLDPATCSGVFGPDSSEALLIEIFGAENVQTGLVPGPEGMEFLATTVFADDPDRRMEFGWWDEDGRTRLSFVEMAPGQIGPLGLHLGMSVADVEAINGEPFEIGGFWWDYGGYGNIFSGAIEDRDQDCFLSLRFAPTLEDTGDLDVSSVAGEVLISSHDPMLETLGVRVQVLTLSYAMPDDLIDTQYD